MNTLQLIKKQINKASASTTHRSLTPHIVVLSVKYTRSVGESHGTFCYRGRVYTK